jgi:hypothetical protein
VEDVVRTQCEQLLKANPTLTFDEVWQQVLHPWENNIPYRMISPRHFEAAALRVCQILFEGNYSGILQPMVHYLPLKKDFSNFDEVIRWFKDQALCQQLTQNAYHDLIASGQYSYQNFIQGFDQELLKQGFQPHLAAEEAEIVTQQLNRDQVYRQFQANIKSLLYRPFPGRNLLRTFTRPVLKKLISLRQENSRGLI